MGELTELQKNFIRLEKQRAAWKQYQLDLEEAAVAVANEIGFNQFFQDPEDGTVFSIVVPEGRFIRYEKVGFVRTRRAGEAKGSLSEKAAKAAGFFVF